MRVKLMNALIGLFVSVVFGFSVCSGADSNNITPNGTPVHMAALAGVLTGVSTGAVLSIPELQGTNTLGKEITGSAKVVAEGETTLNGKEVTKVTTRVDVTVDDTDFGSLVKTEYFQKEDGKLVEIVKQGQTILPATAFPLPSEVAVGESGKIATFTDSLGRSIASGWAVKGDFNNGSILEITTTIKQGDATLATEVTSYYLNAAGIPKNFTWAIDATKGKGTFSGAIKTQRLGAGG